MFTEGGLVNDDIGGILVSFVAGGLTGAAVALLLAPQSGHGTRRLINQRIRDGVDRGRKARQHIASTGRDALGGASNYLGRQQKDQDL